MSFIKTATLFGGIAIFNLLVCLPILLFSSVRRLFDKLPTDHLILNYIFGTGCFTVLHSALLVTVIVASGGLEGVEAIWGLGGVTIGIGLITWILVSFLFPHLKWWKPTDKEEELDGRIALGIGLIWYAFSTGVGLFLLMIFLIAFFFPG